MDRKGPYTIDDLVELTGLSRRTIRFYVEKGLLEAPAGRGRGGFYGEAQLRRLREIVEAREEGRSLASIRARGSGGDPEPVPRGGGSVAAAGGAAPPSLLPGASRSVSWELAPGLRLEAEEDLVGRNAGLIELILELCRRGAGSE